MPSSQYQVHGLEDALKQLRRIEPEYVKQFRKDARKNAADAVTSAKKEFDHVRRGWSDRDAPLTNMNHGFLIRDRGITWDVQKVRSGIKFKLGGPTKRARRGKSYRMFSIMEQDAAGAIYDMAGKRKSNPGKNIEDTLERYDAPHLRPQPDYPASGPSRFMWPGIWFFMPTLEERMIQLVRELEKKINKRLVLKKLGR